MRILPRYLVREWFGPFLFALGALTGIMFLNQLARDFGDLVGKGLSWAVIGEVLGLSIPFIVAMTLPMAVLVGALFAFTRLGADNEITAIKASGVNVVALVRPVFLAGIAVAALNFAFNDQVLPRTNHKLRTLLVDIARKKPTFELKEQMINAVLPGQYYLRAGRIDQAADRLREVVIYDLGSPDRRRTIYADSGYMRMSRNQTDLHLTLFDGFVHDYDRTQPTIFRRVFFRTDYVRMRGVTNSLERTGEDTYKGDRERSVCELDSVATENLSGLQTLDRQLGLARENDLRALVGAAPRPASLQRPATIRLGPTVAPYCRVLSALTRLVAPTPARADTVPRAAPAAGDSLRGRVGLPAPAPVVRRLPPPDYGGVQLRNQTLALRAQRAATAGILSRYRVEIHKKFAIPAMCIVFVLIGAPLALRFPRGGVGLVIGASAGIFGLYYIGLIGGETLADKLLISPFWAMWGPNVLMLLIGLVLFLRVGSEHAFGRAGQLAGEWAAGAWEALRFRWRARWGRA